MEFEFTLKYKLTDSTLDADTLVEHLFDAGCDDAMVGIGQPGHIGLDFIREAKSAEKAILSALADVKKAIPSALLVEVGPDFVGLTDVADLLAMSRQNIRKLMLNNQSEFPAPVHGGSASIWHLALVLQFLQERAYKIERPMLEVSQAAMRFNITKEAALIDRKFDSKALALIS